MFYMLSFFMNFSYSYILLLFSLSCTGKSDLVFDMRDEQETNIGFRNKLDYNEQLNAYTYRNFYNGAGVAIGDINNDGLADIYVSGNLVDNKLYLNQGNLKFQDIITSLIAQIVNWHNS